MELFVDNFVKCGFAAYVYSIVKGHRAHMIALRVKVEGHRGAPLQRTTPTLIPITGLDTFAATISCVIGLRAVSMLRVMVVIISYSF